MTINNNEPSHIAWLDLLRITACFLVVLAHCCDPFVGRFDVPTDFYSGVFWGSFYRPCVPLFVMITGVLLLPTNMKAADFYRKRMKRVIIPFVFWSILSPFFFYFFVNGMDVVNPNVAPENHTLGATLVYAYTWIFNFNYTTIPYWYIYMLIGLYLFMPIISPWVEKATKKELKTVLWIWVFTTTLPYIQMAAPYLGYKGYGGNPLLLGGCDWNAFTTFHYFSGFVGYLLLAHYLVKYPLNWSWKKIAVVSIPMWIVGYAVSSYGFILTQEFFPGDYAKLEVIWFFTGINVLMMTFPFFVVFQKIKIRPSHFLSSMSKATFGVYLAHFVVVHIIYELVYPNVEIHAGVKLPLIAVISFVLCMAVISLLRKIPLMRKLT